MKTLNENDIKNVLEIHNLLSFDTYYTLLNGNTDDEQKYELAKREFVRKQSQLLVTDGAQFMCGPHKGTFRTNYKWQTINNKGIARQSDVLPENFEFTDGFQILSIGSWQRIASTTTFNEEYPLLFRSTIQITGKMPGNNPPETYNLQFLNAGQNFSYEDTIDQAYEQSVLSEEEGNNKQEEAQPSADCTVRFSLDTSKDNNFGFDSYEVSKNGCKDKEKLKSAYKKLEPFREEYLMPWVSLAQYRYAILKVAVKGKFKEITFKEPNSYFTFEPATITPETKQVKITCNNTITEKEYKVEVLADGKVAGGLMFVENSIKKFVILPVYVTQGQKEYDDIGDIVKNSLLKQYFDRAFAPLLIEHTLEAPFELNLDDPKWSQNTFQKEAVNRIKNNIGKNKRIIVRESEVNTSNDKRLLVLNDVARLYQTVKNDPSKLSPYPLFLTNWECQKIDSMGNLNDNNGITPSPGKYASMLFLHNSNKFPDFDIPHEVLHGLGLEHTFDSKSTYTFKEGATQNYMDYKDPQKSNITFTNEKHYTFKWQWELARASEWIAKQKIFLPMLLLLLLISCQSYKSVSCEYDYFPTKDEMVLDSSLLNNLDKKIEINNYTKMVTYETRGGFFKSIYIDTLGITLRKSIRYNPSKKINYSYFSLGSYIGKEYHFDENGNVIKVIDNDEGFVICWQQALFIAKKNTGKKAKEWKISKDFDDDKNKKYWEVYYFEDRDRFLVIDAQTGEIVKRGLSGISTDDVIYDDTFKPGEL
ncbi:peptidase propeptide and YpeB domain protein [Capnocytophaga sp. oral taxon 335 str. F0486]|uniref:PepSY domain-containing protein n=1 Tax=Capnocytophaga sp. oral taxon 335 TaxID=712215 RepID=UPI00026F422D|nr:PepSY domain-containing protein [Capnocytophaga sp. oral taxon 335]EJF36302.1 peptidase propeptide and YpeB domain protein [Capnocytophaga sp. oral taxon 335 str. F0486]